MDNRLEETNVIRTRWFVIDLFTVIYFTVTAFGLGAVIGKFLL